MKIYHGTSEKAVEKILRGGISPRGLRPGNWDHTVRSNPGMVYLTSIYAPYFAGCAETEGRWAIAEVDLDKLDEEDFRPDEDFLTQITSMSKVKPSIPKFKTQLESASYWRERVNSNPHLWSQSLAMLGTIAHKGGIPKSAITKIALFNPESNGSMALEAMQPTITILNYRFCQYVYSLITKWMLGGEVKFEEWMEASRFPLPEFEYRRTSVMEILQKQEIEVISP